MKAYRLYTERKNIKFINRLFNESFKGFTIYETTGYWNGRKEKSIVYEVITSDAAAMLKLTSIAKAICGYNKQDTVLVRSSEVNSKIVGLSGILVSL